MSRAFLFSRLAPGPFISLVFFSLFFLSFCGLQRRSAVAAFGSNRWLTHFFVVFGAKYILVLFGNPSGGRWKYRSAHKRSSSSPILESFIFSMALWRTRELFVAGYTHHTTHRVIVNHTRCLARRRRRSFWYFLVVVEYSIFFLFGPMTKRFYDSNWTAGLLLPLVSSLLLLFFLGCVYKGKHSGWSAGGFSDYKWCYSAAIAEGVVLLLHQSPDREIKHHLPYRYIQQRLAIGESLGETGATWTNCRLRPIPSYIERVDIRLGYFDFHKSLTSWIETIQNGKTGAARLSETIPVTDGCLSEMSGPTLSAWLFFIALTIMNR